MIATHASQQQHYEEMISATNCSKAMGDLFPESGWLSKSYKCTKQK